MLAGVGTGGEFAGHGGVDEHARITNHRFYGVTGLRQSANRFTQFVLSIALGTEIHIANGQSLGATSNGLQRHGNAANNGVGHQGDQYNDDHTQCDHEVRGAAGQRNGILAGLFHRLIFELDKA